MPGLLAGLFGTVIADQLDLSADKLLAKVNMEACVPIWRAIQLRFITRNCSAWRDLDQLSVQHDALGMCSLWLKQGAANGQVDEAEKPGTVAEADDPVLEGIVHDTELDLDDPEVVAVEDGEGFGADEAGDGGQGVLHFAVKGGDAIDEGLAQDNVLAVAVDLVADLRRQGEEGQGRRLNVLEMDGLGRREDQGGLLEGGPAGLERVLLVELEAVGAVVARVRGREGKVLHAVVVGGVVGAQLQLVEAGGRGQRRGLAGKGGVVGAVRVRVGVGLDGHAEVHVHVHVQDHVVVGQPEARNLGRQLVGRRAGRGQLRGRALARGAHHGAGLGHVAPAPLLCAGTAVVARRAHGGRGVGRGAGRGAGGVGVQTAVAEPAARRLHAGVEGLQLGRARLHLLGVVRGRLAGDRVSSLGDHGRGCRRRGRVLAACTGDLGPDASHGEAGGGTAAHGSARDPWGGFYRLDSRRQCWQRLRRTLRQ